MELWKARPRRFCQPLVIAAVVLVVKPPEGRRDNGGSGAVDTREGRLENL